MTVQSGLRAVLLLLMPLSLIACDGGLFGTGDGGDDIIITAGSDNTLGTDGNDTLGSEGADVGAGADNADTEMSASPPSIGSEADSQINVGSFENALSVSQRAEPIVSVINVSGIPIEVVVSLSNGESLQQGPIADAIQSDALVLPTGDARVQINSVVAEADADPQVLGVIDPFSVAASTLSTIIVTSNDNGMRLLPLISEPGSVDSALARVRAVQTRADTVTIQLEPTSDSVGTAATLGTVSDAMRNTAYIDVNAGDYIVSDNNSADGLAPQTISLQGGLSYTLVLRPGDNTVLLIQDNE